MGPRIETGFSSGQLVTPQRLACMGFKVTSNFFNYWYLILTQVFLSFENIALKDKKIVSPTMDLISL